MSAIASLHKYTRDHKADQLYISDPVFGNVTKKLTIEFARRMTNADGSFAGVVVSSLEH